MLTKELKNDECLQQLTSDLMLARIIIHVYVHLFHHFYCIFILFKSTIVFNFNHVETL